jgi:hypothetical protein
MTKVEVNKSFNENKWMAAASGINLFTSVSIYI